MDMQPGDTFHGPSKTLADAHFLLFPGVAGDVHPIHYDVEYAKQSHYGKPLAHGLLPTAMTALDASSAREHIDGFVFVEQGCRYLLPAPVGDTVWFSGTDDSGLATGPLRGEALLEISAIAVLRGPEQGSAPEILDLSRSEDAGKPQGTDPAAGDGGRLRAQREAQRDGPAGAFPCGGIGHQPEDPVLHGYGFCRKNQPCRCGG